MPEPIPFVDLRAQFHSIEAEVRQGMDQVLEECSFIQGPHAAAFEGAFAAAHEAPHAVGCSSGTTAIELALRALGVGPGDEVITTAHTFFATGEAIVHVGAKPVFADILPDTYCLDPRSVATAVTPRTKALLPVHIYGNVCDMPALAEIAREHSLHIVEDAAQAHLATLDGAFVGSVGDMATFSFYPGKNLGAYGDAGAVLTRDPAHDARMRKLRDHGRSSKYVHEIVGYNFRLDGLQAAVLNVKLRHLAAWTEKRRAAAQKYDERLAGSVKTMTPTPSAAPAYHLYVIEADDREGLRAHLKEAGIASGVHYPVPLHLQPGFAHLGYERGALPVTEAAADRVLSLPIFPELTDAQLERVASRVLDYLR